MAQAIPFVQLGFSVVQAKNQSAAGKYNQQVYNRNAQIAEQEAQQIEKQTEVDLQRFDQKFNQLQGQTKTRILTSGADLTGSGLRVLHNNETQAQLERNTIRYNSKVAISKLKVVTARSLSFSVSPGSFPIETKKLDKAP